MTTKRRAWQPRTVTANQLVAYNLRRARELRRLTQQQLAERLGELTDGQWTKTSVSAAETSWTHGETRLFDATLLLALSRALELPLAWFLMPPDVDEPPIVVTTSPKRGDQGGEHDFDGADLVHAVVPEADEADPAWEQRLRRSYGDAVFEWGDHGAQRLATLRRWLISLEQLEEELQTSIDRLDPTKGDA